MKRSKKIAAIVLTAMMTLSAAACGEQAGNTADTSATTKAEGAAETTANDTASDVTDAATDTSANAEADGSFTLSDNVGKIKWLGYFDLATDQVEKTACFEDWYGGEVESEICASGDAYFERLGVLVSSGTSPDLVNYEWRAFPHGMSQNLYTPLDSYIDLNSELWSGIKSIADQYTYGNKHFFVPHEMRTSFALNYNKVALENEGIDDPMELYHNGEWTWDTFENLITEWCNLGDDYIGYTGVDAMSFVATTGTKLIEVTKDGQILNNLKNENVQRCMEWLEKLAKNGFFGEGYVSPQDGFKDGKTLFVGLEPDWCFKAAKEQLQKDGIAEDMAFIPFPRDPNSDTYYHANDTYGYMVPAGASNVEGAIAYITTCRRYVTDPEITEKDHADRTNSDPAYFPKCPQCKYSFIENGTDDLDTCPECGSARKVKFKAVMSEEQYQILQDLKDVTKFDLHFDNVYGFNTDLKNMFSGGSVESPTLLDGPLYHGASYTQLRESLYGTIEAYLDPYREKLALSMNS